MRGKRIFAMATLAVVFASLFAIPTPVMAQTAQMLIVPSSLSVDAVTTFTISVYVTNVENMYAFEFKIKYNIYYLTFMAPPIEGTFLKTGGMPTYFAYTVNPQAGIVTVGGTRVGEIPGVYGTGKLADLTFRSEVAGVGKTTILDLYDEVKLDEFLQPIPELPPGDCAVSINWPLWLLNTELWLDAKKGGKIWTEWQTAKRWNLTAIFFDPTSPYYWPDPYWLDYPWCWPTQTIYIRVRNTGTAGIFIRVRTIVSDPNYYPWAQAGNSMPVYIEPKSDAISTKAAGAADLYIGLFWPWEDFQQEAPLTWYVTGRLQISLEGFNWFYWDKVIVNGQHLPGDGYSKVTPGGDTGKFKILP